MAISFFFFFVSVNQILFTAHFRILNEILRKKKKQQHAQVYTLPHHRNTIVLLRLKRFFLDFGGIARFFVYWMIFHQNVAVLEKLRVGRGENVFRILYVYTSYFSVLSINREGGAIHLSFPSPLEPPVTYIYLYV